MPRRKIRTLKYFLRESLIALVSSPLVIPDVLLPFHSSGASGEPPVADGTRALSINTSLNRVCDGGGVSTRGNAGVDEASTRNAGVDEVSKREPAWAWVRGRPSGHLEHHDR